MASAHVRRRLTKSGSERFVVVYRLGGRAARSLTAGTYETRERAEHVRDQVMLEISAGRVPERGPRGWMPLRRRSVTSVYVARSNAGAVLYVGVTGVGLKRLHQHADSSAWWPLAASFALEHYRSREQAETRERELIRELDPPFNRQLREPVLGERAVLCCRVRGAA